MKVKTKILERPTLEELELAVSEYIEEHNLNQERLIDFRVMPFNSLAEIDVKGTKTKTFLQRWFATLFFRCSEEVEGHRCFNCETIFADDNDLFYVGKVGNKALCDDCYDGMGYHESVIKMLCHVMDNANR